MTEREMLNKYASIKTPTNLEAFAKEIIRASWHGCDGGDTIQEVAELHGLIVRIPFDPATHRDTEGYCEPGDDWFVFAGPLAEKQP